MHQSGDRVRKLDLTVSGDTGNRKDLAAVDCKGYVLYHLKMIPVLYREMFYF